jgi:Tol biopolymer transport system component
MSDYKEMLDRSGREFPEPELPVDAIFRRRDRKRRNERIVAGLGGLALALALILVGMSIIRSRPSPAEPGPSKDRLNAAVVGSDGSIQGEIPGLPVDAFAPALSPDGRTIAFVTRATDIAGCGSCEDGPRIATIGIDGRGERLLTDRWRWVDTPSWSPDGSQVAFVGQRGDGNSDIYVIDADGSNLRRLTTDPAIDEYPSWSPDGSTIIYDNTGSAPPDSGGFSPTQELWTVLAAGGTPAQLTFDNFAEKQPVYSPDGTQIAITRGSLGIWLLDADGTNPQQVSTIPHFKRSPFSPRWSPDGSRLAYLVHVAFGTSSVDVLDPRSGEITPLLRFKVGIADLSSQRAVSLGVMTASDSNGASWLPSGDAILVNRLTHDS